MVLCRIKKGLYLGSFGAARNKAALKSEKVTHNLTVEGSLSPAFPGDFVYKIIDVLDKENTYIAQYFDECFEFGVSIHCFAGISRSVISIVAYLMNKYSMSFPKALEHVKEKRRIACPNFGFMKLLQKFEKSLSEMVVTKHSDRIGIHFLTLWNQKSTNHTGEKPVSGESPAAELPTELNTVNTAGGFVNVKPDKLSVCYTGVDIHGQDVGVVQANRAYLSICLFVFTKINHESFYLLRLDRKIINCWCFGSKDYMCNSTIYFYKYDVRCKLVPTLILDCTILI